MKFLCIKSTDPRFSEGYTYMGKYDLTGGLWMKTFENKDVFFMGDTSDMFLEDPEQEGGGDKCQ